ncbi:MAG: NAD(P)/FAD-dependent oxidoreductase [Actinomycetota bacterium]
MDQASTVADRLRETYGDAKPVPYWLDQAEAPEACAALEAGTEAELAIVGGGFTGLWTAIQAKQERPERDVLLLEQDTIAFGASGRNGGFCDASLTHGLPNGIDRFPDEIGTIERLAAESFHGIEETIERFGIDCDWNPQGEVLVAREPHEIEWMRRAVEGSRRFGHDAVFLDREQVRAELDSPTYLAAMWKRSKCAMVDPARLAWGLKRAALELGVRVHERTPVTGLAKTAAGVSLAIARGRVDAHRAVLATNGFPPLVRSIRRYVVPVYDYVLMTQPLTAEQRASIGWERRQGFADSANHFHYYRMSEDGRILWGGYDAIYHWRNGVAPGLEQRDATFSTLARHFFETFPQLGGVRFSHRWGGVIDTCSRFSVMFGTALDGRVAYAIGYTGMGVAATRFGARTALDLVDGADTDRTRLRLVRSKPIPFPPEPLRWAGIHLTTRALTRADERAGRRGPWLRMLDAVGLGFDS